MEKIRKHFYFSGRVQGVGFRYRSYYIAQSMGLTGWVDSLKSLGITDVFDPAVSDFSPMTDDTAAYLSQAQHAARVRLPVSCS